MGTTVLWACSSRTRPAERGPRAVPRPIGAIRSEDRPLYCSDFQPDGPVAISVAEAKSSRRGVIQDSSAFVVLVCLGVAVGLATVTALPLAIALGVGALVVAVVCAGPSRAERWGYVALLGGTMVFTYGFSNLGVQLGSFPIPLTELLLVPLALVALADPRFRVPSNVLLPLSLFMGIVAIRLMVDFGTYGSYAVRDSSTAVEAFTLLLGYRAVARYGVRPWIRIMRIICFTVFAYASFYPWRSLLLSIGPTVGLQRSVPLLGSFEGIEPTVAVCTLFFAVHSKGASRTALVAWGLALMGILQFRGLYLVLPPAFLIMGWALRRPLKVVVTAFGALAIGVIILAALSGAGISGRVGPISSSFYEQHIGTVLGQQGPHAGSIKDRADWARKTIQYVERSPRYVMFGVGLGPDLAFGFLENSQVLVRKPHDDYLEIFARTGIVGFLVFGWLLVAALRPVIRAARRAPPPTGAFCAWILAGSFVYLAIAATQPLLAFPYGTVPLFFLLGMGLAAERSTYLNEKRRDRTEPTFARPTTSS
jgi:O-antigen ligase/polysaccharide polymerase Wzy-like membrane protein